MKMTKPKNKEEYLEKIKALKLFDDDFSCSDANDMYNAVLSKRVKYLKEEEGVNDMCEIFDNFRIECETKRAIEDLKSLMETLNLSLEEAMKALKIKSEDKDMYRELIN